MMVRLKTFVEDGPLFPVTCIVKFAAVATIGVPVIEPLLPTSVKPDGKLFDTNDQV